MVKPLDKPPDEPSGMKATKFDGGLHDHGGSVRPDTLVSANDCAVAADLADGVKWLKMLARSIVCNWVVARRGSHPYPDNENRRGVRHTSLT